MPNMKQEVKQPEQEDKAPSGAHEKARQKAEYEAAILHEFESQIEDIIDGFNRPYEASKEVSPSLAIYHPSFKVAEKACDDIATEAVRLFRDAKYKDRETEQIAEDFKEKGKVLYSSNQKVRLIGDSGVGKSSLINSLLDTPDLASESGAGGACTQVITEFHAAWHDQKSPFKAEIYFLDSRSRKLILEEHFADLYNYRIKSSECADEEAGDDAESRCSTADGFFAALFADRPEFLKDDFFNQEMVTAFLNTAENADDSRVLGQLPFLAAVDADEMGVKVPSLWPIIDHIEIGMHSPLLSQGLVIADLPGLSDVNRTRIRTTQLYMRTCEYIYVVSPVSRVQTEESVRKRLLTKSTIKGNQRTLICTKIDADIDLLKTKPEDLKPLREDYRQYNLTESTLNNLEGQERKDAAEKSRELRLKKKAINTLRLAALIKMRNQKVVLAMRAKFQNIAGGHGIFKVTCVSNTAYNLHRNGYDETNAPIPIDVTGIPTLRGEALALPAASRLNVMKNHVQCVMPSLLETLGCWSTASTIKKRPELRAIVAKPRELVELEISKYVDSLKRALQDIMLAKISSRRYRWVKHGKKAAEKWAKDYSSQQYKAWCKHDGEHKTPMKSRHSWNADLLKIVEDDLAEEWQRFDEEMEEIGRACAESLQLLVDSFRDRIKKVHGISPRAIGPFLQSLTTKKKLLASIFEPVNVELRKTSDTLKEIATADVEDSYLKGSMLSVYANATSQAGNGSTRERIKIVSTAIAQGKPFSGINKGVKDTFDEAFDAKTDILIRAATEVFDKILKDFDLSFVMEELPDPRRDDLRRRMKSFVAEAQAELDGTIAVELAKAEAEKSH